MHKYRKDKPFFSRRALPPRLSVSSDKNNLIPHRGQKETRSEAAGSGRTSVRLGGVLLFWEVLGRRVHQLPLLRAAAEVVAGVKHAAPVLASSPRSQIRHGVPDRAAQHVMSCSCNFVELKKYYLKKTKIKNTQSEKKKHKG